MKKITKRGIMINNFKEIYKKYKNYIDVVYIIIAVLVIISIIKRDEQSLSNIGQFLSGTVGIIISILGFIALVITLVFQQIQITENQKSANKQFSEMQAQTNLMRQTLDFENIKHRNSIRPYFRKSDDGNEAIHSMKFIKNFKNVGPGIAEVINDFESIVPLNLKLTLFDYSHQQQLLFKPDESIVLHLNFNSIVYPDEGTILSFQMKYKDIEGNEYKQIVIVDSQKKISIESPILTSINLHNIVAES